MAASNNRIRECATVHHILNRIAHGVYFLGEDERNDMIEIVRRAAEFCGLRLLAWCIMTNHFHLMVYLPVATDISEQEILRRYGVLKGEHARKNLELRILALRENGEEGEGKIKELLVSQRRRMYDIGEFMKIVKQWFTEEYNRRHSHVGTLWESAYQDRPVKMTVTEMSRRMGYIHLNPIRAAMTSTYDGYVWSSFAAVSRGDVLAALGIRFVYNDNESSVVEIRERHRMLLDELLEVEKRRRAEEIARKRALGYEMPTDPLTSEAMVAQAALNLEKIQRAAEELKLQKRVENVGRREQRRIGEQAVLEQVRLHPTFSVKALADVLGIAEPTVYKYLRALKGRGLISRARRADPWEICIV